MKGKAQPSSVPRANQAGTSTGHGFWHCSSASKPQPRPHPHHCGHVQVWDRVAVSRRACALTGDVREAWSRQQCWELSRAPESCSSASSIRQHCLNTTRINKATFAIHHELLLLSLTCCCLPGLICSLFAHKHAAGGRQATIKA